MSALHAIFSLLCGQQHNWVLGGTALPFCQRCTGLYVGAVLAVAVFLLFRPKPTKRMLWLHGLFLLPMVPFGYHLIRQTAEIRMFTGQLFAIGLVYYLMLLPGDFWPHWREPVSHIPGYFLASAATAVMLTPAVTWGGPRTNLVLSCLGLAGLSLYVTLVVLNIALIAVSGRDLLYRHVGRSAS